MSRYNIVPRSTSGHCCFEFSVVDTARPQTIGGHHLRGADGQLRYETVCECFYKADAELVCAALNAQADKVED